jgi:hypothetical protein
MRLALLKTGLSGFKPNPDAPAQEPQTPVHGLIRHPLTPRLYVTRYRDSNITKPPGPDSETNDQSFAKSASAQGSRVVFGMSGVDIGLKSILRIETGPRKSKIH